jgi:hypothetical protein
MSRLSEALATLRDLGPPRELRELGARGWAPTRRPRVNTHIHLPPNFSAFGSVAEAVALAAEQGVRVLGAANYYDYTVYGEFAALALERGIFPLFGLEVICMNQELRDAGVKINDPGNPGKMYLCGKGIARFAELPPEAARLLGIIRRNDSSRMAAMIAATEQVFASRGLPTGLDADSVVDWVVRRHGSVRSSVTLQERHVAQAFQEAVFARLGAEDAVTVQNDLRAQLMKAGKPAFVEEAFVSLADARTLILELGGVPCYPVLADASPAPTPFEDPTETLVQNLRSLDLHAAEVIPVRNDVRVLDRTVKALRSAGLIVTAGTEHNTLDLIPMDPTCKDGVAVPDDVQEIFWEGACVIAGHQFLCLHGEPGFVDHAGRPNPAFSDADSLIGSFARLGAAVVRRYFDASTRTRAS